MTQQQIIYWWKSGTLYNAVSTMADGTDPSILYTSTDFADVIAQVGYDPERGDVVRANEAPDLTFDNF